MRFYNQSHQYYCGVDLHARSMYINVLDAHGKTVFDRNLPVDPTGRTPYSCLAPPRLRGLLREDTPGTTASRTIPVHPKFVEV